MAWTTPDHSTNVSRITGYIVQRTGEIAALIFGAPIRIVAEAISFVSEDILDFGAYLARQVTPKDAEGEYLLKWGERKGIPPLLALPASGSVIVTGLPGSIQPTGSAFTRDADGVECTTTAEAIIPGGGSVAVTYEADEAGAAGNCDLGATFTLASPAVGIDPTVTAQAAVTNGRDLESDADYSARMQAVFAAPPQGGALPDYANEAKATPTVDVGRAWAFDYPDLPVGYVRVYFLIGNEDGTEDLPSAGEIAAVLAYLDPAFNVGGNALTVHAPTLTNVDLSIELHVLTGYTVSAVRAAMEAALATALKGIELSASAQTLRNSQIRDALKVPGIDYWVLSAVNGGSGTANATLAAYSLPTVGTITWS